MKARPLFYVSQRAAVWTYWVFFAFTFFTCILFLFRNGTIANPTIEIVAAVSVFSLAGGILTSTDQIWSFSFFEDYFTLTRGTTIRKIDYDQVENVSRTSVFRPFRPSIRMKICLKEAEGPIGVPGNPRSRLLKEDLYSWLTEKVNRPASH